MTATWYEAWGSLERNANLSKRDGQQILGNAIFDNIFEGGQLVAEGPTGVGKALDVDTPIPTPTGWTKMGDLIEGDEVYAEDGTVCQVVKAHDVRLNRRCYDVKFSDGSSIVADGEHLWATQSRNLRMSQFDRRRRPHYKSELPDYEIISTDEIKDSLYTSNGAKNHAILVSNALVGVSRDNPVKPYTLGAWLGDGHSNTSYITGVDLGILEAIQNDGYVLTKLSNKYEWVIKGTDGKNINQLLSDIGVLNNKHIPTEYLRGSYDDRLGLLQGLMDTDGTVSKVSGRSEFVVCNERLALDTLELVRSLGIKAKYTTGPAAITEIVDGVRTRRIVGTRYRVGFTTDLPIARLNRKSILLPSSVRRTSLVKYIESVDPVESRAVRCIEVDSPSRLFLAGMSMTVTHNSFTALIPAICAFKEKNQRTILTTETLSLLDQIVDKDLPFLEKTYGEFDYFGLKGRNHYLCIGRAGATNEIVSKVRGQLFGTNGERRDVERVLGYRLEDDVWGEICGETEFCAHNKCNPTFCYSAAAREKAAASDIVITSHKMLQVHGEFIQQGIEGGLLGDFSHIIVDEAHSLERIVVDGSTLEVAPWELFQKLNTINKGIDQIGKFGIEAETLENRTRDSLTIIKELVSWQVGRNMEMKEWGRQSMALSEIYITAGSVEHIMALDAYENTLPDLLSEAWQGYDKLAKDLGKESASMTKGRGKVNKAITACRYLASLLGIVGNAITTKDGTTQAYGTTFAVFADGYVGRDMNGRDKQDIRLRAVPMDVSQFLRRNLWKTSRSVTLISATLRDHTDGSFRFLKKSLGLNKECTEVVVDSPFNFAEQQIIYLTDGARQDTAEVPGARFSIGELRNLIDATDGRALVLFTSIAELSYVAEELRKDRSFPYTLLVQEKGADKAEIAQRFKDDTNSVLLASKTFFQGFDVPGESLTSLILCKYSLPQYNATTIALIKHWKSQGFPKWYEMKSIETFVQAWGRLIRSDGCRGVVSLLDNRVANPREGIYKTVHGVIPSVYGGVEVTTDPSRVKNWLDS